MSNHASYLPVLFHAFSVTSFTLSISMLVAPEKAWRIFGVSSEKKSLASICYSGALMGEATLQYLAAILPRSFLAPAIMFMVPYKLVSSLGLLWHAHKTADLQIKREARSLALAWIAPIGLIAAALHQTHDDYRKHYFSV